MARSLVIGCLLFVSPLVARAQWGMGNEPAARSRARPVVAPGPRVVFDLLAFKGSQNNSGGPAALGDSTRMDLYLAVDCNSLEFLYAIDKYVADYSVTIQVLTKSNLILDRYEAYTVLETTSEHRARVHSRQSRADARQISFMLLPGNEYTMRLSVQDYSSHASFDTSFDVTVKDFGLPFPTMSDVIIYRDRIGMRGGSPTMVVPSIGPDVSSLAEGQAADRSSVASGLFAELYNMPADSTLGIVTEVLRTNGQGDNATPQLASRMTMVLHIPPANRSTNTAPASIPVTQLFMPVSFEGLWAGPYAMHTYILPNARDTGLEDPSVLGTRAIASAQREIIVAIASGIPISAGDLDQAIAQLGVIASGVEWDSLNRARTPEEKRDAILDFWKKKNPAFGLHASPEAGNRAMEVFYSRVDYANAHFGTTFQAGWKSDRGRVYIELGPPDAIDSHPEGYTQAYGGLQMPYEIWDYSRLGQRYTFVDEYMLGDYRLRGAQPPEGTFIWE